MADEPETEGRAPGEWAARPGLARLLRLLVTVLPFAAAVCVSVVLSSLWGRPDGWLAIAGWLVCISLASFVAMVLVERSLRRLLPLSALLGLTLVFPDQAPSRFRTAMRSSSPRELSRTMEKVRREGLGSNVDEAAETLLVLVSALAKHDRLTKGHSERTRAYADLIASELGLSRDERSKLRWAALLHDVGKIYIPARILNKPGKLTAHEFERIKEHPEHGARLIAPLRDWLGEWADAVGQHHERWDGGGYPNGIAGQQICRGARIVAVADTFDVITSVRSYKKAGTAADARAEIARNSGTQFDPEVVRAFLSVGLGRFRFEMAPLTLLAQVPALRFLLEVGRVTAATTTSASTTVAAAPAAAAVIAMTGAVVPVAEALDPLPELAFVEEAGVATSVPGILGPPDVSTTPPSTGAGAGTTIALPTITPTAPTTTTGGPTTTAGPTTSVPFTSSISSTQWTSTTAPAQSTSTSVLVTTSTVVVTTAPPLATTTTTVPPATSTNTTTASTTSTTVPPDYPAGVWMIASCLGEPEPNPDAWRERPSLSLHGCDLSNLDFAGADLGSIHFHGGYWVGADFTGADLGGSHFEDANLAQVDLDRADLIDTRFLNLTMDGATFAGALMEGTEFEQFSLVGADFSGNGATMVDVQFEFGNLSFADFRNMSLDGVDIGETVDASDSLWNRTTIVDGQFTGDFTAADFSAAVMNDTDFSDAGLAGAKLNGTTLNTVDFEAATVGGTGFNGAWVADLNFVEASGVPTTSGLWISGGEVVCPDGSAVTTAKKPLCDWWE